MGSEGTVIMDIASRVLKTPCYAVDEQLLRDNLDILDGIQKKAGCKIILALKGYAMFSTFGTIQRYLAGVSASSLNEARLGYDEFDGEVHVCSPAYREDEIEDILKYADRITFNSYSQWERYKRYLEDKEDTPLVGLRINPEHSEVKVPIYDPCAPNSRLGVTLDQLRGKDLTGITGLHFHTLCELNADALERTLAVVEKKFGQYLKDMKWVNFGGGHHITRPDYDRKKLCSLVKDFRKKYDVEVLLEPGEAIALNAGVLITTVLDIINNGMDIAILDTSAAAHMPDVLEMPYRPVIDGAGEPGENPFTYRLGGISCLAGDVIGDYSFREQLSTGKRLVFRDMAHYTMVKNNTFNGIGLPSLVLYDTDTKKMQVVRDFGYDEYKNRLS